MTFTASLVSSIPSHRPGRYLVTYTVSDGFGKTLGPYITIRPNSEPVSDVLQRQATALEQSMIAAEIQRALRTDGTVVLQYTTLAAVADELRAQFRDASRYELHRLARWTLGHLTDPQIRFAFNLSAAELITFKARLETMRDRIDAMDAEVGG